MAYQNNNEPQHLTLGEPVKYNEDRTSIAFDTGKPNPRYPGSTIWVWLPAHLIRRNTDDGPGEWIVPYWLAFEKELI